MFGTETNVSRDTQRLPVVIPTHPDRYSPLRDSSQTNKKSRRRGQSRSPQQEQLSRSHSPSLDLTSAEAQEVNQKDGRVHLRARVRTVSSFQRVGIPEQVQFIRKRHSPCSTAPCIRSGVSWTSRWLLLITASPFGNETVVSRPRRAKTHSSTKRN